MKSIYDAFDTDEERVTEGVWLDFGKLGKIRVASSGPSNQHFTARLAAAYKPVRRQLQTETLPEAEANRILAAVYAETIIKGWEGICDRQGKALEFTKANAVRLLTDLPNLFRLIREHSEDQANFRRAEVEEIAKN